MYSLHRAMNKSGLPLDTLAITMACPGFIALNFENHLTFASLYAAIIKKESFRRLVLLQN